LTASDLLGRLVVSKCGRDKGRAFLVVGAHGEDSLLISDGRLRKIGKPKKKKMKHLIFKDARVDSIRDLLIGGGQATDRLIRRALAELSQAQ
jgi:ribosomal protein L14E/L6E/L27E